MILTTVIGVSANIVSLILWLPQAITTWKNRENSRALKGISLGTQILSIMNTCLWCMYGLMTHDLWLPIGTILILPLGLWTIALKLKAK